MSHFAKVVDGVVEQVIVADQEYVDQLFGKWVQTSYNTRANQHILGGTPLRGNYACPGFTYDEARDVFYARKPHPMAVLDTNTWTWTGLPVVEL
jgi:hypothetical protein